jgi:hypothetical protein
MALLGHEINHRQDTSSLRKPNPSSLLLMVRILNPIIPGVQRPRGDQIRFLSALHLPQDWHIISSLESSHDAAHRGGLHVPTSPKTLMELHSGLDRMFFWTRKKDITPSTFLRRIAELRPCPESRLRGGTWELGGELFSHIPFRAPAPQIRAPQLVRTRIKYPPQGLVNRTALDLAMTRPIPRQSPDQ